MKKLGLFMIFCCAGFVAAAQGLEDIIVERYYVSDANDATDEDGGSLTEGSVTYRIFVDMQEGWEIQAVYGNDDHLLRLETTTEFFNNEDRGEETGDAINDSRLDENTVALDSWVTMGPASDEHFGIPKNLDFDGSIVGGDNNDGGSEGIEGGLLANEDPSAGIPLTNADGLIPGQAPSGLVSVGLDLGIFADQNDGPIFTSNGGAWSVLEGVQGVTSDNIVLVAQITTDGDFSFELNIQLGGPAGQTEQYVASNPIGDEILFAGLTFPQSAVPGCVNSEACNFNPSATEDDGSCIVPVANCSVCVGDVLSIIDTDGDGVCDADEIPGCTSDTACNFNPNATDDDGTCSEPVENCLVCVGGEFTIVDTDGDGICDAEEILGCSSEPNACNYNPDATDEEPCLIPIEGCVECNVNNTGLILIDSDGDGICDAEEVFACTSPSACNFDPLATEDDGSCIEPIADCQACNASNTGLEIIDSDGDGICDAEEVLGCTSSSACNFDALVSEDDGSCIEPVADCQACNASNTGLEIIDSDGDGICDAEEVLGCTSSSACNFDPLASEDDGSCIEPVADCQACNASNTGLVIIDSDGDGICDAEEVLGCTSSSACNFDALATEDDGSCIEPVADCQACNASNTGLVIIDSDGDGICDADDTECIGDFDNSGIIGLSDLLLFLPEFGCSSDCNYDLNDSGSVDVNDLLIFLPLFGSTCE